tara:strand:+ start:499 stop:600 length:102 start_codon:yes stop_codon:yes gene_type:complete
MNWHITGLIGSTFKKNSNAIGSKFPSLIEKSEA